MKKRKTNDEEILRLLKEGKTQKQIAEIQGVSPVAICKRVKRLVPMPDTSTFNGLTEKEKKFCVEKAKGRTHTQAALNSFECGSMQSAKSIGAQLMAKDKIRQSIDEIMEFHGLTKSYRIQKLKTHVDNRDANISLKGLDMSFRLDGSYAPEKYEHDVDSREVALEIKAKIDAENLKIQELEERLAALDD